VKQASLVSGGPLSTPQASLRIFALGAVRALAGPVHLDPLRARAGRLLTLLISLPDHSGIKEQVAERLWPDDFKALNNLHAAVRDLRVWLRDSASIESYGADFRLKDAYVDADELETLVQRARQRRPAGDAEAARSYMEAVRLYRGPFFAQYDFEWVTSRRSRIDHQATEALIMMSEAALARHEFLNAVELASRASAISPPREDALRVEMIALCQLGRRSEALIRYRDCEVYLRREVRCRPDPLTSRLEERLRHGDCPTIREAQTEFLSAMTS